MKTIRVWSDFTCPFCYIAETRLRKVMSELGDTDIRIELKAFELDPSAKPKSQRRRPSGMPANIRRQHRTPSDVSARFRCSDAAQV